MSAINAFESNLEDDAHTKILKFYMHISYEKQGQKLQERIDDPEKNWKHSDNDWKERQHWDKYMAYYEYAINSSSIPWRIVPCDKRWYRNFYIASVVYDTLVAMAPELPIIKI